MTLGYRHPNPTTVCPFTVATISRAIRRDVTSHMSIGSRLQLEAELLTVFNNPATSPVSKICLMIVLYLFESDILINYGQYFLKQGIS